MSANTTQWAIQSTKSASVPGYRIERIFCYPHILQPHKSSSTRAKTKRQTRWDVESRGAHVKLHMNARRK